MSEAPDTEVVDSPAPAAEAAPQTDAASDIQTVASKGGWVPKDEWTGAPDKWVDAPQFVLKAAEILPQLTADLKEARAEIRTVKKAVADSAKFISAAEKRAYDRGVNEAQARLDSAAALGDVEGVREATKEIVALEKEIRADVPQVNPDFETWREANPWFDTDDEMKAITVAIAEKANNDGYRGKAQIAEVDRRLKARFPNLGKNPNRDLPGAVEGATLPRRTSAKTFSDMPAEAREMVTYFEKNTRGFNRDKYIKDYFAETAK